MAGVISGGGQWAYVIAAYALTAIPLYTASATILIDTGNKKIVDEMFVFDNLINVEDRGIQLILKEVDNDTLMVALKGAVEELRDKFLRNMSSRAAEMLREDLEAQGPIRMSKVEAEQKKILQIARRLAESGQIVLGNQGDDAYV